MEANLFSIPRFMLSSFAWFTGPEKKKTNIHIAARAFLRYKGPPGGGGLPYETDGDARRLA